MRLLKVRIKNFKKIKDETFEFTAGFNLIKGVNGMGKTSILEAIAVGLGGFVAGVPDVATRHFSIDEIRKEYPTIGDSMSLCVHHVPVEVEICASINGEEISWLRTRNSVSSSKSTIQPKTIVKMAEEMSSKTDSELPVLIYESAGRVWTQKRNKKENPFEKKIVRSMGYADSLEDASNIKMLRKWCEKMEQLTFRNRKAVPEYEAVKEAVAYFMSLLNGNTGNANVYYDIVLEELMFVQDAQALPIADLSSGYQSVIWMALNIAFRMALLNPQLGSDITKTNGIVLIDELDLHLHPRWQWNIINALRSVFPNVQFIATTHAPILFASAKGVNVIDVDDDEIKYINSHYGIDTNAALNTYQRTEEMPPEVKRLANSIEDAMDEEEYEKAADLISELEEKLDDNHPLVNKYKTLYGLETMDWGDDGDSHKEGEST